MTDEFIPFGRADYFLFLGVMLGARGADFLSTWIATPNLLLEANPIARKLGWRRGLILNFLICIGFAAWPLPAVVISTSSLLVAAHNFQSAWLMRSLGEVPYREWMGERLRLVSFPLYLFCLLAQTGIMASVGLALMCLSPHDLVPFAIGTGFVAYAVAVTAFTLYSVRQARRFLG